MELLVPLLEAEEWDESEPEVLVRRVAGMVYITGEEHVVFVKCGMVSRCFETRPNEFSEMRII